MAGRHGRSPESAPTHNPPALAVLIGVPLLLALVIGTVLIAFGMPGVKSAPHDVPIGVTGPGAAAVVQALEERQPGAFATTTYAGEAELEAAIRDRDVYGGFVTAPSGTTILTASAASAPVAQALGQIGTGLARPGGPAVTTRDIVPLTSDDPRGAGLNAIGLPLVLGCILPAAALGHLAKRRSVQIGAGLVYSVVAGFTFAAVLHYVFGTTQGDYLVESAVLAASIGAGTFAILGLHWVLGKVGLALGAITLVLIGNPLSGSGTAPEFLASPWRQIGQSMPPGAGSQLLRSAGFFNGASPMLPWYVLAAWAAAGLVLLAIPMRRNAASPADDVEHETLDRDSGRERESHTV